MRKLSLTLVLVTSLGVGACRTANVTSAPPTSSTTTPSSHPPSAPQTSAQPPPAGSTTLPAGTPLKAQLKETLSTQNSKVGDQIHATLTEPVKDAAGKVLVPAGSEVQGTVTGLNPSPRYGQPAAIRLNFDKLATPEKTQVVATQVTEAKPETTQDYRRAGKGAAIGGAAGAAAGVLVGRSLKGAVIGGLLGAGAGTAVSLGTGDVNATLPAGTPLTLQLTQPVRVG